jgi:hypothetical protein
MESLCLNRKAYILKLFIGLVCAGPNVLFSQAQTRYGDGFAQMLTGVEKIEQKRS